jgi:hypothetical protein
MVLPDSFAGEGPLEKVLPFFLRRFGGLVPRLFKTVPLEEFLPFI